MRMTIEFNLLSQDSQYLRGEGILRSFVSVPGGGDRERSSDACNGQSSVSCLSNSSQISQNIRGAGIRRLTPKFIDIPLNTGKQLEIEIEMENRDSLTVIDPKKNSPGFVFWP